MGSVAYRSGRKCECGKMAVFRLRSDGREVCESCILRESNVDAERITPVEPVCDFCTSDAPDGARWVLHVTGPVIAEVPGTNIVTHSDDDWAVCAVCRPFVDARDLVGLVDHAARVQLDGRDDAAVRLVLMATLADFHSKVFAVAADGPCEEDR